MGRGGSKPAPAAAPAAAETAKSDAAAAAPPKAAGGQETLTSWLSVTGLPDIEGESFSIAGSGHQSIFSCAALEEIKQLCEASPDCVGFAYHAPLGRWYPKKKGTGFAPASASFSQKYLGQTWEWHYMMSRACEAPTVTIEPGIFSSNLCGFEPDHISQLSTIDGSTESQQELPELRQGPFDLTRAMHLPQDMRFEGVPCDLVTFNSKLDVCVRCGNLSTAAVVLQDLIANGIDPDVITFSILIKGYLRAGEVHKAMALFRELKSRGLQCDDIMYNSLIGGAGVRGSTAWEAFFHFLGPESSAAMLNCASGTESGSPSKDGGSRKRMMKKLESWGISKEDRPIGATDLQQYAFVQQLVDASLLKEAVEREQDQVLKECRDMMRFSVPRTGTEDQLLLSMLGIALSPAACTFLERSNLGLREFLAHFPGEFRVEGPKGCERVIWMPNGPDAIRRSLSRRLPGGHPMNSEAAAAMQWHCRAAAMTAQALSDEGWCNFLKGTRTSNSSVAEGPPPDEGLPVHVLVTQMSGQTYGPLALLSGATFGDLKGILAKESGIPKLMQGLSVNAAMPQDNESLALYSQPGQAVAVTLIKSLVNQSTLQASIDCSSREEQIDTLKYLLGSSGLASMLPGIKLFARSADPEVLALAQQVWSVARRQRREAMTMKSQRCPEQD